MRSGEGVRISVSLVSYNAMGGHPALSFAGDLLLGRPAPAFGSAVRQIEAYAHLDGDGPTLPTLEPLRERFRERVARMPQAWFRRKTKRIEVAYLSRLGSADDLIAGKPRRTGLGDVLLVRRACTELTAALDAARKRIAAADDFDADAFFAFLSSREKVIDAASDRDVLRWLREAQEAERQRIAATGRSPDQPPRSRLSSGSA
jgi:hypothetical protein